MTPGELERAARAVLPRDLFEFIATGARDERTPAANVQAWNDYWFVPRALVDVSSPRIATDVLGQPIEIPLLAAPMGLLGLVHPDGDVGLVRATAAAGTIAIIAQSSLTSLEDIARVEHGRFWAQHYPLEDRSVDKNVLESAIDAGAAAIVVTIDFPLDSVTRARPTGGYAFPPADRFPPRAARGKTLLTSLTVQYIDWLRDVVAGRAPIIAKGVMCADDAVCLANHGVSAIVVSNHGGRTLDAVIPTADVLPEIVAAVGHLVEVYVDGGIRRGADVLRALSLGARAVLVGRPLAWGLACGGQTGVTEVLAQLRRELREDSALAGVADLANVPTGLVRTRQ